jgi:hypothetical protein
MTTTNLATEPDVTLTTEKTTHFFIEGLALLETMETMPEDMKLKAYVFDPAGHLLGSAPMDAKGRFNVPVHLDHPADVQLFIGPAGEPDDVRKASVYKQTFFAKDWVPEGAGYQLKPRIFVAFHLWNLWRPVTAFVTGHVRTTQGRPIPYLKVEIFDVDREGIFWPYLLNKKDFVLYRKAVDLRELLGETPRPKPAFLEDVSLNPSPEPPIPELLAEKAMPRVGEMASASTALAEGLDHLTLTSKASRLVIGHPVATGDRPEHRGAVHGSDRLEAEPDDRSQGRPRGEERPAAGVGAGVRQGIRGPGRPLRSDL